MKIFLAGSMHFAKEILETAEILEKLGHEALYAPDTEDCLANPGLNEDEEHCFATDIMKACMDLQEQCQAILVLNHEKNGQQGYIGAHTLIELGLAYYLKQKIFLLHELPSKEEIRHAVEVMHMKPVILNGEIEKINEHL